MFKGSITALVTPMRDGAFDEEAFRAFVNWQIEEGSHGLVPVGTTGESPTLSHDEHRRVVEVCIAEARGRVPVIAGAGSNNTIEAIDLARHAEKAGADAVLVVTPYYNKPSQEGPISTTRPSTPLASSHHLQHPAALGVTCRSRRGAALRVEEHRRGQGRDRQDRPHQPSSARHGAVSSALRRRLTALAVAKRGGHGCIWSRQCRAEALRRVRGCLCRRYARPRLGPPDALHRALFLRAQSGGYVFRFSAEKDNPPAMVASARVGRVRPPWSAGADQLIRMAAKKRPTQTNAAVNAYTARSARL